MGLWFRLLPPPEAMHSIIRTGAECARFPAQFELQSFTTPLYQVKGAKCDGLGRKI